ncbi:MAG TPA: hypothetical protein V6C95_15630 [Coleofasciculaceae cyanobacterium]
MAFAPNPAGNHQNFWKQLHLMVTSQPNFIEYVYRLLKFRLVLVELTAELEFALA